MERGQTSGCWGVGAGWKGACGSLRGSGNVPSLGLGGGYVDMNTCQSTSHSMFELCEVH